MGLRPLGLSCMFGRLETRSALARVKRLDITYCPQLKDVTPVLGVADLVYDGRVGRGTGGKGRCAVS